VRPRRDADCDMRDIVTAASMVVFGVLFTLALCTIVEHLSSQRPAQTFDPNPVENLPSFTTTPMKRKVPPRVGKAPNGLPLPSAIEGTC
jgi:hypothetical protein